MKRAAIYCRISDDREGEALGVRRQRDDCVALAESHGYEWTYFEDNDRGASTRSRKPRPEYARMLAATGEGAFDFIVAYSNSRLTRRPMEFEDLIRLHEQTGIRIVTVVSGQDDLSTADGRMVARIKASVDAAEAERIGERTARAHLENARQGKNTGGSRPFGWDRSGNVIELEATLIRDAAHRLIEGATLVSIRDAWNEAGVVTSRSSTWNHSTIRQMLTSPRLAGWRLYKREVMLDSEGHKVRGVWEPILDQATHDRLVAVLTREDKRGRKPRRGARHYLLSGVLRCATCSAHMYGNRRKDGAHNYACNNPDWLTRHTVAISGPGVDKVLAQLVFESMLVPEGEAVAQPADWGGEQALSEVEGKIAALMSALVEGSLTGESVMPAVGRLEEKREELRAGRADWLADTAGPTMHGITAEQWEKMDANAKRPYISKQLDAVFVKPSARRGNRLDLDRLVPVWHEGVRVPRAAGV